MEVHHHPHIDSDGHRKKKFKEYFWEFLMLFLAVFLGFLAENQREHLIEHRWAKEYAKNLLKDLQADTAEINAAAMHEGFKDSMIDSLVIFINKNDIYKKTGALYYYMRLAYDYYSIDWSRATLNQLLSSGNLRYFSDPKLTTLISAYNTLETVITGQEEGIEKHRFRAANYMDQIFEAGAFLKSILIFNQDSLKKKSSLLFVDSLKNENWPVMSKDRGLVNGYANALIATKTYIKRLTRTYYPAAIHEAIEIMQLLKKEYRLK